MLLDLTTAAVHVDPTRFPGSLVVLVSDGKDVLGGVDQIVQLYFSPSKASPLVPLMVYADGPTDAPRIYRAFALTSADLSTYRAVAITRGFGRGDDRKRIARLSTRTSPKKTLTIEIERNEPSKEKSNHVMEFICDFDPNVIPPFVTWTALGKSSTTPSVPI